MGTTARYSSRSARWYAPHSRDVERVVAAEQHLVRADRVERGGSGDERPDDEHGDAGRERSERRPELASELTERCSVRHDRPDGEERENVRAEQHGELRSRRVGEDDRRRTPSCRAAEGRSSASTIAKSATEYGEVRRALRHHERDVHRGRDGDRERRDSDAPPRTQQAARDQIDRDRRQGEEEPVHDLVQRVRRLAVSGETEDAREDRGVDGAELVRLAAQPQAVTLAQRRAAATVDVLVRMHARSRDELRGTA